MSRSDGGGVLQTRYIALTLIYITCNLKTSVNKAAVRRATEHARDCFDRLRLFKKVWFVPKRRTATSCTGATKRPCAAANRYTQASHCCRPFEEPQVRENPAVRQTSSRAEGKAAPWSPNKLEQNRCSQMIIIVSTDRSRTSTGE